MAIHNNNTTTLDIGVCHLYPGEKLQTGDQRWGRYTRSFVRETHSIASLAKAVAVDGFSISAVVRDQHRKTSNFSSAQHLGLDFDAGDETSSVEALCRVPLIRDHATFVYETPSSTPEHPKARAIFILNEPFLDADEYKTAVLALLWKAEGTADEQCKDPARFFYGRINARHVVLGNILYRDILQAQIIEPFQAASPERRKGHSTAPSVGEIIPSGQRNATLLSLAGTMRRRGMSQEAIEAALAVENLGRCVLPLEDGEVRAIASSVAKYSPPTQAGQAPQLSHRKPFKRNGRIHIPYVEVQE